MIQKVQSPVVLPQVCTGKLAARESDSGTATNVTTLSVRCSSSSVAAENDSVNLGVVRGVLLGRLPRLRTLSGVSVVLITSAIWSLVLRALDLTILQLQVKVLRLIL